MYTRILLAVDGSPTSDIALNEAVKLAKEGTQLYLVTVVDNPMLTFPAPYGAAYDTGIVAQAMLESGKAVLKNASDKLAGLDIKADTKLVDLTSTNSRNIAAALLQEAANWQADLIVIGSHGRRGVARVLLGSVAEEVMRTAHQPVLLVKGPSTGKDQAFTEWQDKYPMGS